MTGQNPPACVAVAWDRSIGMGRDMMIALPRVGSLDPVGFISFGECGRLDDMALRRDDLDDLLVDDPADDDRLAGAEPGAGRAGQDLDGAALDREGDLPLAAAVGGDAEIDLPLEPDRSRDPHRAV